MRRSRLAQLTLATLLALAPAAPALAHAELETSEPAASAVLAAPPPSITLDFTEEIEPGLAEIELLRADGSTVEGVGPPSRRAGDGTVVTATVPTIGDGAYVVSWRVVSVDGHPISGLIPFQVGTGTTADTTGLVEQLSRDETADPVVDGLLTVGRVVTYAGLALLLGGAVFLLAVWSGGYRSWTLRRLVWAGWFAAVVGTVAVFLLTGPYTTGGGVAGAVDADLWRSVADSRVGRAALARLVVLALLVPLVARLGRGLGRVGLAVGTLLGAGAVLSMSVGGHPSVGRLPGFGVALDATHLSAMCLWIGGLALLAVALAAERQPAGQAASAAVADSVGGTPATAPPDGSGAGADTRTLAIRRFSTLAMGCVTVLVVTGVAQAWRQLGGFDGALDGDYGRTLAVKSVLVAGLVGLGWWSRRLVRRGEAGVPLWRAVLTEVAVAIAVLAVTAVLVGTPPSEAAGVQPFEATAVQADTLLEVALTPAAIGTNDLHLTFSPQGGSLQAMSAAEARLALPARADLGRIPVELVPAGANHWFATGVQLPYAGEWQLEVLADTADGVTQRFSFAVPVAPR